MRVVVVGATGAIGVPLVRSLVGRGHEVVGVTRSAETAARNRDVWAAAVVADVLDRSALLAAAGSIRADAVVHQGTALTRLPMRTRDLRQTNELRTRGTDNLLALARALGATRFVTQSFLGGYGFGDHGQHRLTEEDRFAPPGRSAGLESVVGAMRHNEEQVLGATDLAGVALRYGLFYGLGGPLELMISMLRRRQFPIPAEGGGVLSYLHLPDAATATVAALEQGRAGQAYNVCDDEPVRWGTFVSAVAQTFGAPAPFRVPGWLLRVAPYAHTLMTSTIPMSNALARRELDWAPAAPSYRDGLRQDLQRQSSDRT